MKHHLKAKVLSNRQTASACYHLTMEAGAIASAAKPGQFVHLRVRTGATPLLRRPFSIHRIGKSTIEILYKVVGPATEILATKKPGDVADSIGPLGNGFSIERKGDRGRRVLLVAGGMGVAPLVALAETVDDPDAITVLLGARTKTELLCENDFRKQGCKVLTATDDGSRGHKGFVTTLLKDTLRTPRTTNGEPRTTIYACGPHAMLKEVACIAAKYSIPCEVSLEERMACGVGVCLGCAIKVKEASSCDSGSVMRASKDDRRSTNHESRTTNHEYKMVCKDGPVFKAREIAW